MGPRRSSLGTLRTGPLVRITARFNHVHATREYCRARDTGPASSSCRKESLSIALLMRWLNSLHEVADQQGDIFGTFAQRRNANGKHVEAIVEIGTELLFAYQLFQIAICCGDQPGVSSQCPSGPQALKLALLQYAQELGLQLQRHTPRFHPGTWCRYLLIRSGLRVGQSHL